MLTRAHGAVERQPDQAGSPWWGEHRARYGFAAPLVARRRTLDIACGTGYGLSMLGEQVSFIVGADIDSSAAHRAARTVGRRAAAVIVADGTALPFCDGAFQAVTSFETLEHLAARDRFVAELRRVLGEDGVCVLSTPNARYTRPIDGKPRNPFHLHEYAPDELRTELLGHFATVELFGQQLDARFRIPPFLEDQRRLPRTIGNRARLVLRRVVQMLPSQPRDRASQLLWGHDFFPTEQDFDFVSGAVDEAPVLIAVCRTQRAR